MHFCSANKYYCTTVLLLLDTFKQRHCSQRTHYTVCDQHIHHSKNIKQQAGSCEKHFPCDICDKSTSRGSNTESWIERSIWCWSPSRLFPVPPSIFLAFESKQCSASVGSPYTCCTGTMDCPSSAGTSMLNSTVTLLMSEVKILQIHYYILYLIVYMENNLVQSSKCIVTWLPTVHRQTPEVMPSSSTVTARGEKNEVKQVVKEESKRRWGRKRV